jgi:hypothetical protein
VGALVGQAKVRDHQNKGKDHRDSAHDVGHPESLVQCSLTVEVILGWARNTAVSATGWRRWHAGPHRDERGRAVESSR